MGNAQFSDVKPVPVKRSGICKLSSEFKCSFGRKSSEMPLSSKVFGGAGPFFKKVPASFPRRGPGKSPFFKKGFPRFIPIPFSRIPSLGTFTP